jgi:hypothetical protein
MTLNHDAAASVGWHGSNGLRHRASAFVDPDHRGVING